MFKQILIQTNDNLDKLIDITKQDIQDVKDANHEPMFQRNKEKDKIVQEFITEKNQIDTILLKRSESGLTLEEMLSEKENELFDEFKIKLKEFADIHKKFSKMALAVANFYTNLSHKVNEAEIDIGYQMKQRYSSTLSLKG